METCTVPKKLYEDMINTLKEYANYTNWASHKSDTQLFYSNMWYMNESGFLKAQKTLEQIKSYENIKNSTNTRTN